MHVNHLPMGVSELALFCVFLQGPMYPYCDGQVCHGSELVYVFNSAWSHDPAWEFTSGGKVLSECMGAYWGSFVGHNDPNYEAVLRNCPRWSPWDLESGTCCYISFLFVV